VIQYHVTAITRRISAVFERRSDRRDSFRQDSEAAINNARATAEESEKVKLISGSQNQLAGIDQSKIRYGLRFELNDCVGRRKPHGSSAPRKDFPFRSHELDKNAGRSANCFADDSNFVFHCLCS